MHCWLFLRTFGMRLGEDMRNPHKPIIRICYLVEPNNYFLPYSIEDSLSLDASLLSFLLLSNKISASISEKKKNAPTFPHFSVPFTETQTTVPLVEYYFF